MNCSKPWLFCLGLLLPQWIEAQEVSVNPGRPSITDNAHSMAKGHLELELGAQMWANEQLATPFLLKLGMTETTEIRLSGVGFRYNNAINKDKVGFGNLGLQAKWRFVSGQTDIPAMAFLATTVFPTATENLNERSTDVSFLFLASGMLGPVGWDFNTGADLINLGEDTLVDLPIILAFSTQITGPLGVILELADFIPLSDQPNRIQLLGALTWTLSPSWVMDIAFIKGFDNAPNWEVLFGVTTMLAKFW